MSQAITVVLALVCGLAATAVSFIVLAALATAVGLLPTDAEATAAAVIVGTLAFVAVIRRRSRRPASQVA